jgi:hypothetical protein
MKTITKLGVVLCLAAGFSYAETWTGKLIDATCHDKSSQSSQATPGQATRGQSTTPSTTPGQSSSSSRESCAPTASTTSFALETSDGKVYKLDSAGNSKAASAMRGNPNAKDENVTVSGTMEGSTVKVDSINTSK